MPQSAMTPYYGPEFKREGSRAILAARARSAPANATLTITVQHRNASEDAYEDLGSFTLSPGVWAAAHEVRDTKELLRLKYEVSWCGGLGVEAETLPPKWFA